MSKLVPRYTLWEAINTAIAIGTRALEEIRTLARQPGPRGNDGLGFEDLKNMKLVKTGDRAFAFQVVRGKEMFEFPFSVPGMIYRDIHKDGNKYSEGDVVTWSGSAWVAKAETSAKPGEGPDWQLFVKRGRDGKDVVSLPRDPNKPVNIKGN